MFSRNDFFNLIIYKYIDWDQTKMYEYNYKLTNPRLYDESTEVCEGGGV